MLDDYLAEQAQATLRRLKEEEELDGSAPEETLLDFTAARPRPVKLAWCAISSSQASRSTKTLRRSGSVRRSSRRGWRGAL